MATLLVYNVLIRCWLADPDARPSFNDLKNTFSKFVLDPKKYLLLKVSFSRVILILVSLLNFNHLKNKGTFVTINQEIDPSLINDLIYDKAKYNKDENENQIQYEDAIVNEYHSLDTVTFRRANDEI